MDLKVRAEIFAGTRFLADTKTRNASRHPPLPVACAPSRRGTRFCGSCIHVNQERSYNEAWARSRAQSHPSHSRSEVNNKMMQFRLRGGCGKIGTCRGWRCGGGPPSSRAGRVQRPTIENHIQKLILLLLCRRRTKKGNLTFRPIRYPSRSCEMF